MLCFPYGNQTVGKQEDIRQQLIALGAYLSSTMWKDESAVSFLSVAMQCQKSVMEADYTLTDDEQRRCVDKYGNHSPRRKAFRLPTGWTWDAFLYCIICKVYSARRDLTPSLAQAIMWRNDAESASFTLSLKRHQKFLWACSNAIWENRHDILFAILAVVDPACLTTLVKERLYSLSWCGFATGLQEARDKIRGRRVELGLAHFCAHNGAVECLRVLLRLAAQHDLLSSGDEQGDGEAADERTWTERVANLRNVSGCTPLHIAASRGSIEVVTCLLEAGADVNGMIDPLDTTVPDLLGAECDKDDSRIKRLPTPRFQATCHGHFEIATLLTNQGAALTAIEEGVLEELAKKDAGIAAFISATGR